MACGIPLGAIVANEKAAKTIRAGMHGTTYGGGPLACRVALEFFDILDELLPSINAVGGYFRMRLTELARRYSFIREVRGQGLMIGVELDIPGKPVCARGHSAKGCCSIARMTQCCASCRLTFWPNRTWTAPSQFSISCWDAQSRFRRRPFRQLASGALAK